jgi:putative transcriptional regulator
VHVADYDGTLTGRLLVATPPLVDPNFDRTVVLMLEHGDDGAIGVVLNRPSGTHIDDVLPEWRSLAAPPPSVFVGGPVSPEAVIALGLAPGHRPAEGFAPILGDLGTVDVARDPLDLEVPLDQLRVFAGYAGWAPGQLEDELDQNAWFVVDLRREDPFAPDPEQLWRSVLRRQRGEIAFFAHYPEDVTTN